MDETDIRNQNLKRLVDWAKVNNPAIYAVFSESMEEYGDEIELIYLVQDRFRNFEIVISQVEEPISHLGV